MPDITTRYRKLDLHKMLDQDKIQLTNLSFSPIFNLACCVNQAITQTH